MDIANLGYIQLGGDSLSALALSKMCKTRGIVLSLANILRTKKVVDLLATATIVPVSERVTSKQDDDFLQIKPEAAMVDSAYASLVATPVRSPTPVSLGYLPTTHVSAMTELQLTLLQGSMNRPGSNIIRFVETYRADMVDVLREAWKQVIESEPIFRTRLDIVDGKGQMSLDRQAIVDWKEVTVFDESAYESELSEVLVGDSSTVFFKLVTLMGAASDDSTTAVVCSVHHAKME